jgi:hypothetical protein
VGGLIVAGSVVWVASNAVECSRAYSLDGPRGCVVPLLLKTDTEFAAGYSNAAFRQVRVGMTADDVITLLGTPLGTWPRDDAGREWWSWSRSPGDHSYRVRTVLLEQGRVTGVGHGFYVD